MDQEDTLDFKALRAKFQDEELLIKQPRIKPTLPEKPKVVPPPPQSPTNYIPAGARPSLLHTINQSLEGKTAIAPRVVFKDEKASKKPLVPSNSKKMKSEPKFKLGVGGREKLVNESPELKKKETSKDKKLPLLPFTQKESTAELVPVSPPPKVATQKKKGFTVFKKSAKKESVDVPPDPILDSPSLDIGGALPLIPVPSDFDDTQPNPETSPPKALMPIIPPVQPVPDSDTTMEITSPSIIPISPSLVPPPALIPDFPSPESETPEQVEPPALSLSTPESQNKTTPPPSPPQQIVSEAVTEAVSSATVEAPPPSVDSPSIGSSPKLECPVSALSVLERAEDLSPSKRTSADQRILAALEKARKKLGSSQSNQTSSASITPPPEDLIHAESPTLSLPPVDYQGNAFAVKPEAVNGIDYRQASPELDGTTEDGAGFVPEMLVIPPPPPRKPLPDPVSLGSAPDKPDRPPVVDLSDYVPPPLGEDREVPLPLEFSEADTTELDDVGSVTNSAATPISDWGNGDYTAQDTLDGQYSNGITTQEAELHEFSAVGDEYQDHAQPLAEHEAAEANVGVAALSAETPTLPSEDGNTIKKKGKSDSNKKRTKGPPKNPYDEATPPNEEKKKTGLFGKSDKKVSAEGPDEKELKKREKQRLEKEKKELKEKQEREKKEQKEREKKENEMKKKFKITGQEDAMYQATVTVTTKGRKNDLPVKSGDIISVIRTTNCPKGKWLARDNSNNYGYVAVDHVELDIKEMLELGKKAAIRKTSTSVTEAESTGSRASNHFPLSAESFTDDSEEWTGDDDDNMSPATEPPNPLAPEHNRTTSMPEMGNEAVSVNHQHSHSDIATDGTNMQGRHEALQKLATFFYTPKPVEPASSNAEEETSTLTEETEETEETEDTVHLSAVDETQDDFDNPGMIILPPPDLYADLSAE